MEKISWKVEGMHCANCALTINKFLQNKGARNISVNAIDGDVSFEVKDEKPGQIAKGIESLGYKVKSEGALTAEKKNPFLEVVTSIVKCSQAFSHISKIRFTKR